MSSDLKELLDLLDEHSHIPGNDVEEFIKTFNLKPSRGITKNYVIYWVYLKWKASTGKAPMARISFFKLFSKYFKPASTDRARRYYVEANDFLLHPSELEAAKTECKKERIWQGKRRGGRISSPKRAHLKIWLNSVKVRKEKNEKRKKGI